MKKKLKQKRLQSILMISFIGVITVLFLGANHLKTNKANTSTNTVDMAELSQKSGAPYSKDVEEFGHPALESKINQLLKIYHTEGLEAAETFALERRIPFENGKIQVLLAANPMPSPKGFQQKVSKLESQNSRNMKEAIEASISKIRSRIEHLGGNIKRTHQNIVQCSISPKSLPELAHFPQISSIRCPQKVKLHVVSEGVQKTGAHQYHNLGSLTGEGAKVCVIDAGFTDYQQLLGTELPDSVTARSFTDDGDIEGYTSHGTACAEIVHDMAPDAELFLTNIYWDIDLIDAVDWAVSQDIDIISYSMGTYFGAGDGTGLDSALAEWAYNTAGITWVTSAGNEADCHWSGTFNDPDGDGWHNFAGEDELLSFQVTALDSIDYGIDVYLKWNDWGTWDDYNGYSGSDQDFDLYLYIKVNGEWEFVDSSANRQPDYKWPWESMYGWYSYIDAEWGIAIRQHNASKNVFFDLYIPTHTYGTMEYLVPEGSLSMPADSPYVIAVGSVDAIDNYYHTYSSQGPTLDGRIKPDICAPSGVSTSNVSYGLVNITGGFHGTSAACPHVAGAIALLKGKTPFTLAEIKQILYNRAIDMGVPGKDNKFGIGHLNLLHQ